MFCKLEVVEAYLRGAFDISRLKARELASLDAAAGRRYGKITRAKGSRRVREGKQYRLKGVRP